MGIVHKLFSAKELSSEWDNLASSYWQKKKFLIHCEQYNPSNQRYYEMYEKGSLVAGAVMYTLPIDIFTYIGLPSPIKMQIIGVPASVSSPGFIGNEWRALLKELLSIEKGFLLGLNLDAPTHASGVVEGSTLPTLSLNRSFASWDQYKGALRSSYRRRLNKVTRLFDGVEQKSGSCGDFNREMYKLYLNVFAKSDAKLEKLSFEFFHELPKEFTLTSYHHDGVVIAWAITLNNSGEFYFFMGGIDYEYNDEFSSYFNITVGVVKTAIEQGYKSLDFGQTAEIPKSRLGGQPKRKLMFAHHSNSIFNFILTKAKGLLEYNRKIPQVRVFSREKN
jgi:Acetyltransferase (GNAT) domain